MTWKESGSASLAFVASKMKVLASRAKKKVAENNAASPSFWPFFSPPKSPREHRRFKMLSLSSDKRLLEQRLDFLGLTQAKMAGDGNCQFRSVSYELYGTQAHHAKLREVVVDWMRTNPDNYSPYVENFDRYLKKMSRLGNWGDEITLRAMIDCLNIHVHLITSNDENWHILYTPDKPRPKDRHVFLAYIGQVHYNAVTILVDLSRVGGD
jgi:hypothetical protein